MQWPENFEDINNLELLAQSLVEGFIIGLHKSPYHGFSVEFAEHRLYHSGDNLKHVDWKVYGRKDIMFTKKFEEETNLRCVLAIDCSNSMLFPEGRWNKLQHSTLASAALTTLLKKQLDAFAIYPIAEPPLRHRLKFSTTLSHYKQQLALLQEVALRSKQEVQPNISKTLHEMAEQIHQRALVIIFTDIPYQEFSSHEFTDALLHLKYRKHEIIVFHLLDEELEQQFQYKNEPYEFVDLESRKSLKLFPNTVKEAYLNRLQTYQKEVSQFCLQHNISLVPYNLKGPITKILQEYLQKRSKMM